MRLVRDNVNSFLIGLIIVVNFKSLFKDRRPDPFRSFADVSLFCQWRLG